MPNMKRSLISLAVLALMSNTVVHANDKQFDYSVYSGNGQKADIFSQPANQMTSQNPSKRSEERVGFDQMSNQQLQKNMNGQGARQVGRARTQFVGGGTDIGFTVNDQGDVGVTGSHVIQKDATSTTTVMGNVDVDYDDELDIVSGGARIHQNWVSEENGVVDHINKVYAAVDQNRFDDTKVTIGYGQETENFFWDAHGSTTFTDETLAGTDDEGFPVYRRAYDYGIGANIGTFIDEYDVKVHGGLEYQFSKENNVNQLEDRGTELSLTYGIEKFFEDSPHSVALTGRVSKKDGGFRAYEGSDDLNTAANLSYKYNFADNAERFKPGTYQKRVRVEVPGKSVPIVKKQPIYVNKPIYKKKAIHVNKGSYVTNNMQLAGETFFKKNSAKLTAGARDRLSQIAAQIRRYGHEGAIRITGHTCALGNLKYDQWLSEQRAKTVRKFFLSQGFDPKDMIARGYGKEQPKYRNNPDEGFKNRRVDVEFISNRKRYEKKDAGVRYKTVQVGTKRVVSGYKDVVIGHKPGQPRVVWKTQIVQAPPAWVERALNNNITHNSHIGTYFASGKEVSKNVDQPDPEPTITANNDTQSTVDCSPVTVNVLGNDTASNNQTLTLDSIQPLDGSYLSGASAVIVNNQILYTPSPVNCAPFTEQIEYTMTDGNTTSSAVATITNTVSNTNTSSITATPDVVSTAKCAAITISPLGNDSTTAVSGALQLVSVAPANGSYHAGSTVTISGNNVIYTPDPSNCENFSDNLVYTVTDGTNTTTSTIVVNNTGTEDSVLDANTDVEVTQSCAAVTISPLANDSTTSNGTLSLVSVSPANGSYREGSTVSVNGNEVSYVPATANCENFTDNLIYTVTDGTNQVTSTITVINTVGTTTTPPIVDDNDTITANIDVGNTASCAAITVLPLSNDISSSGGTLSVTDIKPANGSYYAGSTVQLIGNSVVYTPATSDCEQFTDSIVYTVTDGESETVSTIIINNTVPTPPTPPTTPTPDPSDISATPDVVSTAKCAAITISPLGNDSTTAASGTLQLVSVAPASGGYHAGSTVTISGNNVIYTPDPSNCENFSDNLVYTVTDGTNTTTSTIVVNNTGTEDSVLDANTDVEVTQSCAAVTISPLANDSTTSNGTLSLVSVSPANGSYREGSTVTVNGNEVSYVPATANCENFTDNLIYTVTDGTNQVTSTITVINTVGTTTTPPIVDDNDTITANIDVGNTASCAAITVLPLSNDISSSGGTLSVTDIKPANGSYYAGSTVQLIGNSVVYTPATSDCEQFTDSIVYTVTDGESETVSTIIINNTVPTPPTPPTTPTPDPSDISATPDVVSTAKCAAITISPLGNDSTTAASGTLQLVSVAPASGGYHAGSTVTISGNNVIYTPDPSNCENFSDNLVYTVTDGTNTTTSTIVVNNTGTEDSVLDANTDVEVTQSCAAVTISPLANDSTTSNGTLSLVSVSPANGSYREGSTVSVNGNEVSYVPATANCENFTDNLIYTVTDGTNQVTSTITVVNTIGGTNAPPPLQENDTITANIDVGNTTSCASITIVPLSNDITTSGGTLSVTDIRPASGSYYSGSTVQLIGNSVVYTPATSDCENFTDSIVYTVTDGDSETVSTIFINNTVTTPPTPPTTTDPSVITAVDDAKATTSCQAVVVSPLVNDSDSDGATLSLVSIVPTDGSYHAGSQVSREGNNILYTPATANCADFSDQITYTVSNGSDTTTAVVTITNTVPNTPTSVVSAVDDSKATQDCAPITVSPLTNDSSSEGNALSLLSIEPGSGVYHNGADVQLSGNNIIYTPKTENCEVFTDTIDYVVSDGESQDSATVTITNTVSDTGTPGNPGTPKDNTSIITANDDSKVTTDCAAISITPLSNDNTDIDAELTLESIAPANGAYHNNASVTTSGNTVWYTPNTSNCEVFTDQITYVVSDGVSEATATITVTNTVTAKPPTSVVTANNDQQSTISCKAITVFPLGNDSSSTDGTLSLLSISPANGSFQAGATVTHVGNSVVYTPDPEDCEAFTDQISYIVSDGISQDSATITITNTVPATPELSVVEAHDDSKNITSCEPVTISPLVNDSSSLDKTMTLVSINPVNGSYHNNGTAVISGNNIVYTPGTANCENFTDQIEYTVSDGDSTDTATVTINNTVPVNPPSSEVTAVDDSAEISCDSTIVAVLNNDSSSTGGSLSLVSINPANGSYENGSQVTIVGNSIKYVPGFDNCVEFTDEIEYTVSDGIDTDTAILTIINTPCENDGGGTIEPVCTVAESDTVVMSASEGSVSFNVLDNDQGLALRLAGVDEPGSGEVVFNSNGTIVYTPEEGFTGTDEFWYDIVDGEGYEDAAVITVTVY